MVLTRGQVTLAGATLATAAIIYWVQNNEEENRLVSLQAVRTRRRLARTAVYIAVVHKQLRDVAMPRSA
jgi:hypothetical protein